MIWLSEDWPAKYSPVGYTAVDVIVCISGSETCLVTTGMLNSHTNSFLSSELVTNLFCSMKVIVLTVPRCWLYYIYFLPVLTSNCMIFRLLEPHRKIFWCSGAG